MRLSSSVVMVGLVSSFFWSCGGKSARNESRSAGSAGLEGNSGGDGGGGGAGEAGTTIVTGGDAGAGAVLATGGVSGKPNVNATGGTSAPTAGGAPSGGEVHTSGGTGLGGGTSTAGVGGSNPDLLEPPPNCRLENTFTSEDSCNYVFLCEGGVHFADCERQSDGTERCQCGTFSTPTRYFAVEGAHGLEACGATARACKSEELLGAPSDCVRDETSVDVESGACSLRAICGPRLELAPGVNVRPLDSYGVDCDPNVSGQPQGCVCRGGALDQNVYWAESASVNKLCDAMLDFCIAGAAPTYGEAGQCAPPQGAACEIQQWCGGSSSIADDVTLREPSDIRWLSCSDDGGGLSTCQCRRGSEWFDFAPVGPLEVDDCRETMELCSPSATMEAKGDVSCSPQTAWNYPRDCGNTLSCTRPFERAGVAIKAYGYLALKCVLSDAGSWWCSCASVGTSANFELGEAVDSSEACGRAAVRCQADLEVFFGLTDVVAEAPEPTPE